MSDVDWNFLGKSTNTMLVIASPPEPAKPIFFYSINTG
jgi:hypothetical protein